MTSLAAAVRRRWRAWAAATVETRRDVLAMGALVPVMHVAVRTVGYHRTAMWIAARATPVGDAAGADASAARGARAVQALRRHGVFRGNCLSRALALRWWLGRRGVVADIRFGVRTRAGALEAHAWVERHGIPLTDPPDVGAQFVPLSARSSA